MTNAFSPAATQGDAPEISIVCPCHNEQLNVIALVSALMRALAAEGEDYEIVLVDDGSRDETWSVIETLCLAHRRVRGVRLSRNFGHQRALLAGLAAARGRAIVSMDGDLQHPPEVVPRLLAAWRDGAEVVATVREDAGVASPFKRTTSKLYYRLFSAMAGIEMREGSSDFRLLDRRALDVLLSFAGRDEFLRGSVEWLGFRTAIVPFRAAPRAAGRSAYGLRRMLRFAATGLTSFSNRPLRAGIWLGLVTGALALVYLGYVVVVAMTGEAVPGWASTVGVMTLLFSVLYLIVGIIGVYIARIHAILLARPDFVVAQTVGGDARSVEVSAPIDDAAEPTRRAAS